MNENGKTLFTKKIPGGTSTFFLDVRQSEKNGSRYLVMTQSRRMDGVWKSERLILFPDHALEWKQGVDEAVEMLGT